MPEYEIEQYELHVMEYRVQAESEAEAIVRLLDGEAEAVDNGLEYIEVAEDFGLPVGEHRQLASQLTARGVPVGEHVIPSIRSVEQVE